MAEYIEREALLNALKEERKNGNFVFTSKWIKEIMDNLPTANVIPKSEVAKEIFAELDKIMKPQERYLYCNPSLTYVYEMIEELKKKYTESEDTK